MGSVLDKVVGPDMVAALMAMRRACGIVVKRPVKEQPLAAAAIPAASLEPARSGFLP